ncbi:DNA-directed RNA polymerase subunit omega [Finegoldia magna]|uniref:DNA-directed RNA polymerase subunit omega n=3 Tax=Finegoldia magna TaxID=1260 RepID=RPOZ_FINM2|nr:DNA-directed RNA polymerase subunit omega [Finegoldia magna]B0S136.1 RecName: Full=DNA-directed RNA polymerase subunit omega; Short=RNAP omega subunit; AltName: Full=RNA polymerase omega subunit; AltName: Full=Transcriptase subunit omega [Finegoldia magna ATCC 29328]EFK93574.1 DNA-directed RNA polymerase, omega subunit [Finegoldia magna ACS-171-V-Col3]EFL54583.1 DNA-directed RNA polymerase, omega subunit [Finegoldia magna BVS033A4]EGS33765.1 DNA-directed RNA polymerase, omega subunit [Finego
MINPSFKKLSEINNSRYALCVMVSKRARMLIDGKETKLKKAKAQPVTTALEEVMEKKVWEDKSNE